MDAFEKYEALAGTTQTRDITTQDQQCTAILDQLRRNDPGFEGMSINFWADNEDNYVPVSGDDLGWLGYFIGKNTQLKELSLSDYLGDNNENTTKDVNFCQCVSKNKSIETLCIMNIHNGLADNHFHMGMLVPMFENLKLTRLEVYDSNFGGQAINLIWTKTLRSVLFSAVDMGDEVMAELFRALGKLPSLDCVMLQEVNVGRNACTDIAAFLRQISISNKLVQFYLFDNGIGDEGIGNLVHALADCMKLRELKFSWNPLSARGFQTFSSTLFRSRTSNLEAVDLSRNQIDDERLGLLTTALLGNRNLRKLILSHNPAITTKGWQTFSALLERPDAMLEGLDLLGMSFADEEAILFANALSGNKKLRALDIGGLGDNSVITERGLAALSQLLSDSSSINKTYHSNHTLQSLGKNINGYGHNKKDIAYYLAKNRCKDKKKVAAIKILYSRPHFNMQPLFEWGFKTLPLVVGWFKKAAPLVCDLEAGFYGNCVWLGRDAQRGWLSAIYQFIRGLPTEYIELRLKQKLEEVRFKKRRLMLDLEETEDLEKSIMNALKSRQSSAP